MKFILVSYNLFYFGNGLLYSYSDMNTIHVSILILSGSSSLVAASDTFVYFILVQRYKNWKFSISLYNCSSLGFITESPSKIYTHSMVFPVSYHTVWYQCCKLRNLNSPLFLQINCYCYLLAPEMDFSLFYIM